MTAETPSLDDIFCAAVEITSADDRAAHIVRACGQDAELRAQVEKLVEAHFRAGSFLDQPAAALGGTDGFTPLPGEEAIPMPLPERAGTIIGPYKLMELIGEGGMGLVFVAEQQHPVRRKVAVKVIKPGMDSRDVIARFEAERQALALMDHPNIARVFDAGATESGRPYFVMELIRGVEITRFCDENRLTPRERLELFIDVCQAVQHAHQKGIIHRDLKATNILVTLHDGTPVVKVIDFGVAKAIGCQLTDKTIYTRFAQMIGTPMYMSPEQAELSGLDIDTRSDIYALGVLLYEILTGATPFDKERLRTAPYDEIRRIVREEVPPRPSQRMSTLLVETLTAASARRKTDPKRLSKLYRGELDWIVMKALEKDRNRRYETASAFAADVRRYLNNEQVQACPPSVGYRLRKFFRRYQGPALAASILLLALLAGVIGTTWGMIRARDAEGNAVNEAGKKETALSAVRLTEQEATEQLFQALLNQARAGRFSRQIGQRLDSLEALEKAARIRPDERLRDEAMAALALPDVSRGLSLHVNPAGTAGIAFDSLYQSYARINARGDVSIRSLPDDVEIRPIETKSIVSAGWSGIRLSPNGQFVAILDDRRALQLWCVADRERRPREELGPCWNVAFSPDSRQAAIAKDDWVLVIDLASSQETQRWRLPSPASALAFHPDKRRLAVGYVKSTVVSIYDSAKGAHVTDLPIGSMNEAVVAWHPDGVRLAVAGSDPRIQIWDVAAQRKLAVLEGHVQNVTSLNFHPEGALLASNSWDGVLRLWDSATGRQLMQLPLTMTLQFSSTGRLGWAWPGGDQIQLLDVIPSREYRTIVSSLGAGRGNYQDGEVSPDGRLLALGMEGAGDRLWDLSSGRELAALPSESSCVLFQAGGRALFTCSATGLQRWPVAEGTDADNELRLGPPRKITLPILAQRAARSRDGRKLAVVSEAAGAGLLLDLATESAPGQLFAHQGAGFVALSPDDRWIATSGWHSDRVRLWNAKTGTMANEWVQGSMGEVFFTPDSRALIICRGDAFTFWDVETFQPIRRLDRDVALYPGYVAFSPDGALMALEMAPAVIHLKEVATGRTITKLEDPHGDRTRWMSFTPDGTQLVTAAPYAKAIHVWNLRAMRQRLKEMRLDWEWPEFRPAVPQAHSAAVAKVVVLPGDPADPVLAREQKARQAIEKFRRDVEDHPDAPLACNNLAWIYLTAPKALRDVKAALPLAEKAASVAADKALYRNTLGVAYYRAGRFREAVDALRPNLDKQDDSFLGFDLYFLAMSCHGLGETERAQDYLAWAVRWTAAHPELDAGHLEELRLFRAEAEELLGIKKE